MLEGHNPHNVFRFSRCLWASQLLLPISIWSFQGWKPYVKHAPVLTALRMRDGHPSTLPVAMVMHLEEQLAQMCFESFAFHDCSTLVNGNFSEKSCVLFNATQLSNQKDPKNLSNTWSSFPIFLPFLRDLSPEAHIVEFLLDLGINSDVRVDGGWTAANIATWADQQAVLAVLDGRHRRSEGGLWQSLTHWMGLVSLGWDSEIQRLLWRLVGSFSFGHMCVHSFFLWGVCVCVCENWHLNHLSFTWYEGYNKKRKKPWDFGLMIPMNERPKKRQGRYFGTWNFSWKFMRFVFGESRIISTFCIKRVQASKGFFSPLQHRCEFVLPQIGKWSYWTAAFTGRNLSRAFTVAFKTFKVRAFIYMNRIYSTDILSIIRGLVSWPLCQLIFLFMLIIFRVPYSFSLSIVKWEFSPNLLEDAWQTAGSLEKPVTSNTRRDPK